MTVLAAVREMAEFKSYGRKRTAAFLHQLCHAGFLGQAPLYHNRRYFFLDARGAAAVAEELPEGVTRQPYGPLSERAKIKNYAMLTFCCLGNHRPQRLSPADFTAHFPDLVRPGLP